MAYGTDYDDADVDVDDGLIDSDDSSEDTSTEESEDGVWVDEMGHDIDQADDEEAQWMTDEEEYNAMELDDDDTKRVPCRDRTLQGHFSSHTHPSFAMRAKAPSNLHLSKSLTDRPLKITTSPCVTAPAWTPIVCEGYKRSSEFFSRQCRKVSGSGPGNLRWI